MLQTSRYVYKSRNLEKNNFNRNLTVYCCVIQRLVTSDGSYETQNDPGQGTLIMSGDDFPGVWGVLRGSNSVHDLIGDIYL